MIRAIILIIIFTVSCKCPDENGHVITIQQDSITIAKQQQIIESLTDSITILKHQDCKDVQKRCDSLRTALAVQNYRVGRIRYYVGICNRRPSQDKFLRGWINRTLR